jgi:hypothetical protein
VGACPADGLRTGTDPIDPVDPIEPRDDGALNPPADLLGEVLENWGAGRTWADPVFAT